MIPSGIPADMEKRLQTAAFFLYAAILPARTPGRGHPQRERRQAARRKRDKRFPVLSPFAEPPRCDAVMPFEAF